ncbi:MAG: phosphoribosylaminoimidazolesuccinocarboxamide synthase [Chloroflexi bacterium]|nr:phosphoribosylaminoimidazolesuccinocarboxamide synthase [Chloroflexota bacterium]
MSEVSEIPAVYETSLPGLLHRGKVRDMYDLGDPGGGLLLMVATDRISAFDVIMPDPVPGKGIILTQMSKFWFSHLGNIVPNHMVSVVSDIEGMRDVPVTGALAELPDGYQRRSMVIRRAKRIDMECVVRNYLAGSAWLEYKRSGTMNGALLPADMREAERLPEPVFTPSTKAEHGHDEPLSRSEGEELVGKELYRTLEQKSIEVFSAAHGHAESKGMILADSKFEFGYVDGELTLIDEVLTPDSSRFWDADDWKPGSTPPAYDKQYLRDWLLDQRWNREPPAPSLPASVVAQTQKRYLQAYERLTGETLIL